MPPKRKRVGDEGAESPQKKQQLLSSFTSDTGVDPLSLPELIKIVFHQLRWKDLPTVKLVCSQWFNIAKNDENLTYKIKYMKEYGGYSARTYETITEDNDKEFEVDLQNFSGLNWKEKYDLCASQEAEMYAARDEKTAEDPMGSNEILTVWALENGHYAFLKKLIADHHYSNLEYYEGRTILDLVTKRKEYKCLKVIMTDLPQNLLDEIDLFTILFHATSNGDIRMAKKLFKYGFKCSKELSGSMSTSAALSKNYAMMKLLSDNNAAYYNQDLVDMCKELGWSDINWRNE